MNNSQMEESEISCDIMAEQQCRAEEQRSARSALKEKSTSAVLNYTYSFKSKINFFCFFKKQNKKQPSPCGICSFDVVRIAPS